MKVNGKQFKWTKEITVEELLKVKNYTFPKLVVKINGTFIPKEKYAYTFIQEDDEVQVIHLLAGG